MNINPNKIILPTKNGIIFEVIENILYFQSNGNYSIIKTIDGKKIDSTKSLKLFEENFGNKCFIRVHKSYLINFNHVVELVSKDELCLILIDGSSIKISARKRSYVRKLFIYGSNQ
ncbi:MAG: LytTR family DNA-binding domain-containing protein [Bacteroidetes bacterium]|nr:LytTR family DNA-binding domain-containing protein [Bacteroidota bacterium]